MIALVYYRMPSLRLFLHLHKISMYVLLWVFNAAQIHPFAVCFTANIFEHACFTLLARRQVSGETVDPLLTHRPSNTTWTLGVGFCPA